MTAAGRAERGPDRAGRRAHAQPSPSPTRGCEYLRASLPGDAPSPAIGERARNDPAAGDHRYADAVRGGVPNWWRSWRAVIYAASARFYGDVLGLELIESSPFANAYEVNGTQLRVTRVDHPVAAPYTVLGWRVDDIARSIRRDARRGRGEFKRYGGLSQDENDVWMAPSGSRIAWFSDPDGNTLSLQQAPSPS